MDSNKRCIASMEKNLKKLEPTTTFFFPTPEQFRDTCLSQAFSLPKPIMKYILENPSSSEVYEKLIKTCKLFFLKNPILVLKNMEYSDYFFGAWSNTGWKCCTANECDGWECEHERERIDMDELNDKIWLSKRFSIRHCLSANVASALLPKIARSDIAFLELTNQHLTYNELKFLSSSVKECCLDSCVFKYDDNGEYVSMDNTIKLFSGAEKVTLNFLHQSVNAFCKSYDAFINACNTVKQVELNSAPAAFDAHEFYQCLKNSKNRALIKMCSLGDVDRINELIEEILATKVFNFVPPVIYGTVVYCHKLKKMKDLQEIEAAKYR